MRPEAEDQRPIFCPTDSANSEQRNDKVPRDCPSADISVGLPLAQKTIGAEGYNTGTAIKRSENCRISVSARF